MDISSVAEDADYWPKDAAEDVAKCGNPFRHFSEPYRAHLLDNPDVPPPNLVQPIEELSTVWNTVEKQGFAVVKKNAIIGVMPKLAELLRGTKEYFAGEAAQSIAKVAMGKLYGKHLGMPESMRKNAVEVDTLLFDKLGFGGIFHRDPGFWENKEETKSAMSMWFPLEVGEVVKGTKCTKQLSMVEGFRLRKNLWGSTSLCGPEIEGKRGSFEKGTLSRIWITPGSTSEYVVFFRAYATMHSPAGTDEGCSLVILTRFPTTTVGEDKEHRWGIPTQLIEEDPYNFK